jgi:hypothetical protein
MTQPEFIQALESALQLRGVPFGRVPDPTPITSARVGGAWR